METTFVNEQAKRAARRVDLHGFLLEKHPNDVLIEGDSLRLCDNHSVSVKTGYSGYTDFADGSTGNSVDFLVRFLGYSFQEAVIALCQSVGITDIGPPDHISMAALQAPQAANSAVSQGAAARSPPPVNRPFTPPEAAQEPYYQLFRYLTGVRGIPAATVRQLIDWGLLYQARDHSNIVFIDPARSFAEMRGSSGKPFHRVAFSDPAAFWWMKAHGPDSTPTVAFICEGAIDAISLYLLRSADPALAAENGLYCSIGGVANQQRIDRIKAGMAAGGCQTVIAVDNDEAGDQCRQRNADCPALIPAAKDWNEDLLTASWRAQ